MWRIPVIGECRRMLQDVALVHFEFVFRAWEVLSKTAKCIRIVCVLAGIQARNLLNTAEVISLEAKGGLSRSLGSGHEL